MAWTRLILILLALESSEAEIDWHAELEALGRGDASALARLRRIVSLELARTGAYRAQAAWDDLAQEVVIRVWRAHRDGRIRDMDVLPAYLRRATRNALIDWIRRHRRDLDTADTETLEQTVASDESTLDPVLQIQLRKAVGALSERHREVVEQIYLPGRSYEETAKALDRPRGTINRLQREAMAALREQLMAPEEQKR
jgi:RNA polymerase sigma-70 factor (ECF subfamily)